ncbi:hypothetical protein predicted by Glimmer/Critica [Sorangium cellulosum So ce56]|uniref:Uncharacterized protein n=1 Tax=Sorangium cellulosum (strain So ce56) TaxID=448385 RepID=A9FVE2_SORC5|nr:hypothetical protein [Sorangium cellulosum]CAN92266.1 hypothetical protein predicted by Glimmer/Critica [Sorangium cellulosum So ce56]
MTAERARAATVDKPIETPRVIGRFAIELWIGRELLDRARFNVPLTGDDPPQGNRNRLPRPRFDQDVTARVNVRIADNPRMTYLLLVDRESGATPKLIWRPEADGRLLPWTSGVSDAKPGDFPDSGVRAAEIRDGGMSDAGAADSGPADSGPTDAGRD